MRRPPPSHPARPWLGACLALLACWACAPGSARGGCLTHDLPGVEGAGVGLHELEILRLGGDAEGPRGEGGHAPCTGVFCSGAPAVPQPPAPAVPTVGPGQWAILLPAPRDAGARPRAFPPAADRFRPVAIVADIFHPPRLATPLA